MIQAQERESGDDSVGSLAGLGTRNPALAWALTIGMLGLAGIPGTVGFVGKFQLIHALVDGNYTWLAIVLVIGAMISLGYYLRVVAAIWMGRKYEISMPEPALAPIAGGSPEADRDRDDGDPDGEDTADEDTAEANSSGDGETASSPAPVSAGEQASLRASVESSVAASVAGPAGSDRARRSPDPELVAVAVVCAAAIIFFGIVPQPLFNLAAHAGAALTGIF